MQSTRGAFETAADTFLSAGFFEEALRARLRSAQDRPGDPEPFQALLLLCSDARRQPVTASLQAEIARTLEQRVVPGEDHKLDREVAAALASLQAYEQAARRFLVLQEPETARKLLVAGRAFEALEALDLAEANQLRRAHQQETALAEIQSAEACGQRRRSLARIHQALDALHPPGEAHASGTEPPSAGSEPVAALRQLKDRLLARRPGLQLSLRVAGERYVALQHGFPIVLGRGQESPLPFRDAGVSRRHATIERSETGFLIRDLGSRNGTVVDGLRLGAALTVTGPCRLELGDALCLKVQALGANLCLDVERGLLAGRRCIAFESSLPLSALTELHPAPDLATPDSELPTLVVQDGWISLSLPEGGRLNDRPLAPKSRVELLRSDRLELQGLLIEVDDL